MKKIISFDIWDTILKRKCHPEEVKLHTCQYLFFKYKNLINKNYNTIYDLLTLRNDIERSFYNKNENKGLDRECDILDVFKDMNKILFENEISGLEDELMKVELEHEKNMSYVNPDFLEILDKYKNCEIYCISDFYMKSKYLEDIIKSKDILNNFKGIYSSADYMLTKQSGRLFEKFREDLDIDYSNITHIGDNNKSDIEIPKSLGINTIPIKRTNIYPNINNREFNLNKIVEINNENSLYNVGKKLSIIPYYFILRIMMEEYSNSNDTIYYFTREGEVFKKVHEVINNNGYYFDKKINSELLCVSRIATFAPSLKEFSIDELMNMWNQYKKQSMKTLFISLNINIDNYTTYFEKYAVDIDEEFDKPWENATLKNIFNDDEFLSKINNELKEKRNEFIKYCSNISSPILNDSNTITVVDIGWRGTIQDNISKIFDKKFIRGYYLALFPYFNEQPKNVEKISIIEDKSIIKEYVGGLITLFEMLFIPNTGSVLGYKDGKAIRKQSTEEQKFISENIVELQKGMFDGVKKLDDYLSIHPIDISDLYKEFINCIINTRKHPDKILVDTYYKIILNNNFGSGNYVNKKRKLTFIDKINIKKCLKLMRNESWKEAFLIYNNLNLLRLAFKIKKGVLK